VVTYKPGQIVEFHRTALGSIRCGVQEERFKSGEQWEVLRREEGAVIVGKDGVEKQLPLDQTRNFSVFEREKIMLGIENSQNDARSIMALPGKTPKHKPLEGGARLHFDQTCKRENLCLMNSKPETPLLWPL
jgi:hypothetical protein